ncbi:MAG TPA: carbonic anhydrase [Dehalococcoidia bacterium]|nr:carbonic anhydrase [Dehalococcoidia bacterium]
MTTTPLIDRSACTALVLTCSDFRFKSAERAFAEASGLTDDYDLIARPGAARLIVAPRKPAMRDTLLDEVRLLWSVHHFPRILLVNHVSCRAYDDIATSENEQALHADHLQRAAEVLTNDYANTSIETYLVDRTPTGIAVRPIP